MANVKYYDVNNLSGLNVYQTKTKQQAIYYDPFTKTPYIISSFNVRQFSSWQLRLPTCLLAMGILFLLKVNIYVVIAVGVIAYIASTLYFHFKFLPEQPVAKDFVKPKRLDPLNEIAARCSAKTLISLMSMFLAMALIILIGYFTSNTTIIAKKITIIIIVVSLLMTVLFFYLIYLKGKQNQQIKERNKK